MDGCRFIIFKCVCVCVQITTFLGIKNIINRYNKIINKKQKTQKETNMPSYSFGNNNNNKQLSETKKKQVKPQKVKYVSTVEQFNKEITSSEITLVKFSADWCKPCVDIKPFVEELAHKYPTINFIHVNVDNLRQITSHYKVSNIPCFIGITKDTRVTNQLIGADQEQLTKLVADMKQYRNTDKPTSVSSSVSKKSPADVKKKTK